MKCYCCPNPYGSKEHIINKNIGGRLSSKQLLCNPCNKKFGHTIDAELEGQLGAISDLLGIKTRHKKRRVRVEMVSASGDVKVLDENLKTFSKLSYPTKNKYVEYYVPDDEFEKEIAIKKKELENGEELELVLSTELPPKENYQINNKYLKDGRRMFGGWDFFRSVAKMCVNYYLYMGYDRKLCKEAIAFINNSKEDNIHYYYYPTNYKIHVLEKDELSHIIHLRGDQKNRMLYAYIELFNFENAIVILNVNYLGEDFSNTYCYDVRLKSELHKEIKIKLTRQHFLDLDLISRDIETQYSKRYYRVIKMISQRQKVHPASEI